MSTLSSISVSHYHYHLVSCLTTGKTHHPYYRANAATIEAAKDVAAREIPNNPARLACKVAVEVDFGASVHVL
jgi:hypothetical protein